MIIFKYNKKIDQNIWKNLITNGNKFGHQFPSDYKIFEKDITEAKLKIFEFQSLWHKYQNIFQNKCPKEFRSYLPMPIICFVNTSPYSSFDIKAKTISISFKQKSNRAIPSILHELNHYYFMSAYTKYCISLNCSYDEINEIKEIMTVINNDLFSPMEDPYWKKYEQSRKKVLAVWRKSKNIIITIECAIKQIKYK